MKNRHPIRMCIACRSRYPQNTLIRLKQVEKEIIAFDGTGRSFYLCRECLENPRKVEGLSKRFRQDKEKFVVFLRALATETNPCD